MQDDLKAGENRRAEQGDLNPDSPAVVRAAKDIVGRFGGEAPLRAELAAQSALAAGDLRAYRLFKLVEGAAETMIFLHPDLTLAG